MDEMELLVTGGWDSDYFRAFLFFASVECPSISNHYADREDGCHRGCEVRLGI